MVTNVDIAASEFGIGWGRDGAFSEGNSGHGEREGDASGIRELGLLLMTGVSAEIVSLWWGSVWGARDVVGVRAWVRDWGGDCGCVCRCCGRRRRCVGVYCWLRFYGSWWDVRGLQCRDKGRGRGWWGVQMRGDWDGGRDWGRDFTILTAISRYFDGQVFGAVCSFHWEKTSKFESRNWGFDEWRNKSTSYNEPCSI